MKKAGYEKSPGSTLKTADIERNKRETGSESRKPGLCPVTSSPEGRERGKPFPVQKDDPRPYCQAAFAA